MDKYKSLPILEVFGEKNLGGIKVVLYWVFACLPMVDCGVGVVSGVVKVVRRLAGFSQWSEHPMKVVYTSCRGSLLLIGSDLKDDHAF